jgi:hypothetical protein
MSFIISLGYLLFYIAEDLAIISSVPGEMIQLYCSV